MVIYASGVLRVRVSFADGRQRAIATHIYPHLRGTRGLRAAHSRPVPSAATARGAPGEQHSLPISISPGRTVKHQRTTPRLHGTSHLLAHYTQLLSCASHSLYAILDYLPTCAAILLPVSWGAWCLLLPFACTPPPPPLRAAYAHTAERAGRLRRRAYDRAAYYYTQPSIQLPTCCLPTCGPCLTTALAARRTHHLRPEHTYRSAFCLHLIHPTFRWFLPPLRCGTLFYLLRGLHIPFAADTGRTASSR